MADLMTARTCSTAEAARELQMGVDGIVQLIKNEALRATKVSNEWRIEIDGVLRVKEALGIK